MRNPTEAEEAIIQKKIFQSISTFARWKKIISTRLWQITHPSTKINWVLLVAVVIFATGAGAISVTLLRPSILREDIVNEDKFGLLAQVKELKVKHSYYTKVATKDERLVKWVIMFSDWDYEQPGNPKFKKIDCSGAVYLYLQAWGSNLHLDSTKTFVTRANNLADRGELSVRKNSSEVRSGDIILIGDDAPSHMGIVYDVKNDYIQYMDVNGLVKGMGLERKKWGDGSIVGIYEISYALWVGDLLRELNK